MTVQFHDMVQARVAQVGLVVDGGVQWSNEEPFTEVVRIRGADLTEVRRRAAAVRSERPAATVVAEIEVVIAASEREARAKLPNCGSESPDAPLLYVGTPRGLAGLISDLHAVGIADGAVLVPIADGVADLIRHHVLPAFGPYRAGHLPDPGKHRSDTVTSDGRATITDDDYRATLRRHPAGVAIITLMSESGPVGFTATSFASLSLSPPLVCFNITHTSSSIAALRAAPSVVVHLLGEQQLGIAKRFSATAEQRFADPSTWTTLDTGEPVLVGTPTWLRAGINDLIAAGDSTLVIAEVTRVHCDQSAGTPDPLLYHDGQYRCAREIGTDLRTR